MFKREIKVNFKSFCVWSTVLIAIFMIVFLVYPSILNGENATMLEEMMTMFPEEILKAFNMDIASINSAYGWLKSEGFVFVLLIIGCYAGVLGSNILLKEESDKTIEYLNSLPVTRNKIVKSKALAGVIYIILMVLVIGVFNYIGLALTEEFDKNQFVLLSITPLFPSLAIYFICMFLSTFTHKTKKMLGLSLGVVMVSYILNVLSTMGENLEYFKYLSVFTLADIRNVILETQINIIMPIISVALATTFLCLTRARYNKKDLV